MRKWSLLAGLLLVAFTVAFTAWPAAAQGQGSLAVVYDVGGRGDLSFNDMAAMGADRARRELGVMVTEVESATTADFLPNLRALARSRQHDVIVGIGFLIQDALTTVAQEFPNQKFALIDGFVDAPNVLSISFSDHEGSALVGALAAMTTLEAGGDTVGIVLGIEIPILLRFEIGYRAGVRWAVDRYNELHGTNKQVRVLHTYTGAFDDPARGKAATEAMLAQGAHVVYAVAGGTGLGVFEAVEQAARAQGRDVGPPFAIGVDSAQDWIAPGFIPVSMVKRVDNGVFAAIEQALAGTFEGGVLQLNLAAGGVAASSLDMLDVFMDEAVAAGKMRPEERVARLEGARAAREAVPPSAWEALNELDQLIRSGDYEVPEALDRETAEYWREVLSN
ncbi:MAG: BMP family ABC transporter substrate-binding protein [Firmicutes bacterium]|nr:BMP family ABC transporter substrate-binding protein [Bacillota bacterium]